MDSDTDDDSDKEALLATATTTATAATNGTNGASSAGAEVKGLNPVTVVRRCTDCFWIVPFLLNCAMCGVITWHSDMHANLSALFRLPDFMGHDCGGRFRKDKPYLYFCMEKPSEHIFNEKNKSLDLTHPICVSKCPETFNTSSLCYVGGNTNSSDAWEWVQDYPSQPLAGCICRPHIHFAVNLYKDYDKALTTAPPNLTVLLYIRNWPIYMLSIFVSICFSIAYILMLSKCARILIWISFLVVAVASGLMCIFFSYHFNTGNFKDVVGHRAGDPIDLMRGVGTFIVFVFSVCQMCSLRSSLDSAGRVLELACQCVLSTPSLVLMPLILALQRTWLLCWWLIVIGNYFTSELQNGETKVKHAVYGTTKQWENVVIFPTINKVYAVMFTFGLLWFNEVITAAATLVMYFTGQVWQLLNNSKKQQVRCRTVRGYCIMIRYHCGTVALAGFLQLFLYPLHITLGFFEDAGTGPVGFILESFCSCVLDFYRNNIGPFKRDALQGVSLHSMSFYESAIHYHKRHNALEDVRVLNTQAKIFQIGGLSLAGLLGYLTVVYRLQLPPYENPDEMEYVHEPFPYCVIGGAFAFWVALPFVKIFDVVSDAVLYAMWTEKLARPPPEDVMETFRNCGWTRTVQKMSRYTGCHCGMNRDGLPIPKGAPPGKTIVNPALQRLA